MTLDTYRIECIRCGELGSARNYGNAVDRGYAHWTMHRRDNQAAPVAVYAEGRRVWYIDAEGNETR